MCASDRAGLRLALPSAVRSISRSIVPAALGVAVAAASLAKLLGWVGDLVLGSIAGLGIAGLAGALLIPKPPRPTHRAASAPRDGDLANLEQAAGTVELIGLRSTHARTRFEVHLRLALVHSQQIYDIGDIGARMEALLACHPAIAGDPSVHPTGQGAAWFGLEAMAWFDAPDWAAFQPVCDQLLLACLDICHERARRPAL